MRSVKVREANCTCKNCGKNFWLAPNKIKKGWGKFCNRKCQYSKTMEQRFFKYVIKNENGCWGWSATTGSHGYGQLRASGTMKRVHRLSWLIHFGPIPKDMFVCHQCDNRQCTNPEHLFLGSRQDNVDDMMSKGRNADFRGELNGRSKLSAIQIKEIRALREAGVFYKTISERYGVALQVIFRICQRQSWKHIT